MVALIREPPRDEGPRAAISLRSSHDEVDVSAIARQGGGGGHRQAAGFSSDAIRSGRSSSSFTASSSSRRCRRAALNPVGMPSLVDKPAGPSSFALVARLRRRTRARTGHAGTLDPFATGLLLAVVRSGNQAGSVLRRPRQALRHGCRSDARARPPATPRARSSSARPAAAAELDARLAGPSRRDRAADSRRFCGEDRRRARLQAGPSGRRGRDAPAALARARARRHRVYDDGTVRLELHVSSGHLRARDRRGSRRPLHHACAALRSVRFTVEEADAERIVPGRGGTRSDWPNPGGWARDGQMKVARVPSELEVRPRSVALGTFDGVHVGHHRVIETALGGTQARSDGRDLLASSQDRARERGRVADDARAAVGVARSCRHRRDARGRVHTGAPPKSGP